MKKFQKNLLFISVMVLSLFTLVACKGNKDLDNAFKDLTIDTILSEGDTKESVTKDLTLVSKLDKYPEVKITWSSSNVEVITIDGKVTRTEENVKVKLTAKLELDKKSKLKDFELVVVKQEDEDIEPTPEPEPVDTVTVSEFLKLEKGEEAYIEGVITSLALHNSFSLADDSSSIAFRISGKNSKSEDLGFEVGHRIIAKVKKSEFNGLIQAELIEDSIHSVSENKEELPKAKSIDELDLTNEVLKEYQAQIITATNLLVIEQKVDNNGNIIIKLMNEKSQEITLRGASAALDSAEGTLADLKVGDAININDAVLGWHNAPQIQVNKQNSVEKVEITDKLIIASVAKEIDIPSTLIENTTLELIKESKGVALVWEAKSGSDNINLETGEVTIPKEDTTLELVVTLTKGEDKLVVNINIELKPLEIKEGELIAEYTFDHFEKNGSEFNEESLKDALDQGLQTEDNFLESVEKTSKIYEGNGSGGGDLENVSTVIKISTGSANGEMVLKYNESIKIKKVVLEIRGWGKDKSKVNLNGLEHDIESADEFKEMVFEFTEGTNILDFRFIKRSRIKNIKIYS